MFGPYLVYEKLGVGGMATVHRAAKRGIAGFERVVGLKRLLPHLAEDEDFVRSFVREAKLAAVLQHANIVQIYELGRVASTYFMAMEYIQGHDIRQLLRRALRQRHRLPVQVVLSILGELCDALDYAHNRADDTTGEALGIVHRDVSPSNLIVTPAGHLKVIDFGIAKATANMLRTETGRVKGKLAYMSPEALRGRALDARSDVFSAGVVAHELLSVRPLFASKSDYETMRKIHDGEVLPPSAYNPDVPHELDDLVLQALARAPDERFPTAAAMREAIHDVARDHGIAATSTAVADWIELAFGDDETVVLHNAPPAELDDIDDELTEIVWGARTQRENGVVVIPGVPDVSDQIPFEREDSDVTEVDEIAAVAYPSRQGSHRAGVLDAGASPGLAPRITYRRDTALPLPPPSARATAEPVPDDPADEQPTRALAVGTTPPPFFPADVDTARAEPAAAEPRRFGLLRFAAAVVAVVAAAVLAYAIALRRGPATLPPPATARVAFEVEPRDAAIEIDGREAARATPFELELSEGAHHVAIRRDGYEPWATRIDLRDGQTQMFRIALDRAGADTARVEVRSTPPGLAVAVDGNYLPTATPVELELAPGPHRITVSDRGDELWRHDFEADAGTNYLFHPVTDR